MIGFGFVSNLPIWVAQDRGLFKREGLEVRIDQTPGSVAQIRDMMSGKYQIAMTDPRWDHLSFVHLSSRRQARRFLRRLQPG